LIADDNQRMRDSVPGELDFRRIRWRGNPVRTGTADVSSIIANWIRCLMWSLPPTDSVLHFLSLVALLHRR
jgi:hypothetical protein